jgi:hypothetical protein
MNRAQRRLAERMDAKRRRKEPSGSVSVPPDVPLADGERFTIAGVKRLKNGTIFFDCKPGQETVFVSAKK